MEQESPEGLATYTFRMVKGYLEDFSTSQNIFEGQKHVLFLQAADGSLVTDEFLKVSGADGLFAAGDVATYSSPSGEMRIEHWDVATSQGRYAAKSMVGKPEKFDQTPFFWTSVFGKNLRYVGHCKEFDEVLVDGDLKKLNFVAYYCQKDEALLLMILSDLWKVYEN